MAMAYRRDIDGLRALAVLAVLVFHLNPRWLGGGFIGVDLFFVISGFLITRQVLDKLDEESFSFFAFYTRRARRLFPAALALTALTGVLGYFLLPNTLKAEFFGSVLFSTTSTANFYFWKTTSYFDAAASTKPLLHMWSLGVEEQFYLVWPALLFFTHRQKHRLRGDRLFLVVLLLVGTLSFWGGHALLEKGEADSFYLPHLRGWEFALGGIASLSFERRSLGAVLENVLFLVGAALVAWPLLTYTEATPFPGLHALPPCLGAVLIISAKSPLFARALLANPVAVGLGRISYSVYLVHWPLIVLYSLVAPRAPEWKALIALGVASIVLGYCSWRWIEEPFRRPRANKVTTAGAAFGLSCALAALLIALVSATLWAVPAEATTGTSTERNKRMLEFLARENEGADRWTSRSGCYPVPKSNYRAHRCLTPKDRSTKAVPQVLVVGDSLAANLYAGLRVHWGDRVTLDLAAASHCRPIPLPTKADPACISRNKEIFEKADLSGYDAVLLRGNFFRDRYIKHIAEGVKTLRERGAKNIVLIGPGPEYRDRVPDLIAKYQEQPHERVLQELTAQIQPRNFKAETKLRMAAQEAGIPYVSILELRCPGLRPENCEHTMGPDGDPITRDNIHFTRTGAVWALGRIEQAGAPWAKWLNFKERSPVILPKRAKGQRARAATGRPLPTAGDLEDSGP